MMTYLEEYHNLIKNNEIVVGYWIRKEIQNLIEDLQNPEYIYDTSEAHKRIAFMEKCCLQTKAPYYMKPLKLMPFQKAWWEAIYSFRLAKNGKRRFIEGLLEIARKNGKALALDTRIPTPLGDKTVSDIQPLDYVYGANGEPVKVLAVSEIFENHKCYIIEFEDGERITADAEHRWHVKEKLSRGYIWTDKTTAEMLIDFAHPRNDKKGTEFKYRVPLSKAVQKQEATLPMHPYILGVWLGDGLSRGARISCGKQDLDEMAQNIKKYNGSCKIRAASNKYLISLSDVRRGEKSEASKALRILNVKNNKHIPDVYLNASIEQRRELLQGLMDTDGFCSKAGECEFVQKSERLTMDFSKLLTSLGIKHSIKNKIAKCNGKEIPVFRVIFYVSKNNTCFKLERKTARLKESLADRMNAKSIINIIPTKSVPTKCLCVEGELYLCGERNTVTHNSTMFAADAMYDLFLGEGGSDIACASNDDKQCRIIWEEIGNMRERLDPKRIISGQNLTRIVNKKKNITVFRLSSKTQNKDGYNISKTYLDESHDIKEENEQSEIAEACWRGMSSREEPLFLNCTTQGFNRECYLDAKIAYAKKVIEGEKEDPRFIAFLYEQDSENEIWQDTKSWEKSNPALRYGVKKIDKFERDVEVGKFDKATRIYLLTKDFNIPQSTAQSWLMLEDYDYQQKVYDLEDFRGSFVLGAVDLAATTDLANAKILLMKPNDKTKYVYSHYFIPESKLTASADKEAGAEYKEWAKQGYISIHEGNEIDISAVADWFFMLYKEYGLRPYKIGYDQRYAKTFLDRCEEYGIETEMLAQGRNLSNAMKLTEADLKSKNINYGNNPVDKWCLRNCACEVDNIGNIQPVKIATEKTKRIDGAVTLIMLTETFRRYRSDFIKLIGGA